MKEKKLISAADFILILSLLAAAVIFYFYAVSGGGSTVAEITVNGETVQKIQLDRVSEAQVITADECVITAENGEIFFTDSPCPDKLCIKAGRLKKRGDTAACLPCGVLITVTSSEKGGYDAVAY